MSFSLEEYAKKRRGTETPSASPRSGTDDGIKQAGGFSLAEYHRQKTGGAESQTFGILGSGNKKISPSGAGAKQTAQPKQKPPVATAAPMGLADLQAEKRWIAGELEKGRKRREAVKTQPAAAKKAPTGLGAIKELDRSLQAQRDYEVYKATGELPAEPGQIRGMQPLADKDLKRAREAERQARAAYQAVTGPTTTYPTGEQPQPSVPYAAGLQSREQQRRAEDRPVVEALLPTGPARAEAKGRVYDLDGAYGAAVERKKWDAMPTDLTELKARKETVTAERDEAEREMKRLWAERYALGDNPAKEAERAELTAKYDAAAAAYKEKDRELTQLGQRQYEQRNTQAFGRMSGDEDVGEVFQSALEIQDDMDRILAYMANSRRGGVDTPTARQFVDQVKEKYGITASGQGELQQICGQLRQRLEAARGQVSEAGYDFRDMAIYTRREEKAREQAKRNEQTAQFAEKHPVIASAASGVASLAQWADLGNMDWGHGKPGDEDYVPPDTSAMGIVSYVNTVRGTVGRKIETNTDAELFGRNVGSFLYQTGMSMVDSGLSIATLGPGSIYLMGANAAVNTSKEIVDRGGTAVQAFWGGLAAGAAEMLFEKVSVDRLLTPKSVDGWKDVVRELLTQGGVEASEEVCTEIANILSDTAIMGANSNYANAVRDYRAQGMSEEEAKRQAYLDQLGQVAEAGLGGFVSGVGMAGGKVAVDYAGQKAGRVSGPYEGQGERRVWEAAPQVGQGTRAGLEPAPTQAQKTASVGETDGTGLVSISENERRQLSTGKRNFVADTVKDIVSFARAALAKKGGQERLYMGVIPDSTAQMVREQTGFNVTGYKAILTGDAVQHTWRHHGDPVREQARGQRAVTAEDYGMLGSVLAAPDSVRMDDGTDSLGRPILIFSKQIGDLYVTAQAVTDGRHALTTNSLWVQKKKGHQDTTPDAGTYDADPVLNVQDAPSEGPSIGSIPQSAQGVKAEARRAHEAEALEGLPLVKRMGASGRTGLTNILDTRKARGGLSDELARLKLAEGYQEIYVAGLSGVELEPGDIPLMAGPNAELLDPVERLQAYHNGVNDAKAQAELNRRKAKYATVAGTEKGLVWDEWVAEHLSEEEADRIHETAKRLGVRVRVVDQVAGGLANGQIVGADIQIAKDAEQPIMVVFGHEVGHWLERTAPEAYQAMRAFTAQHRMAEVEGLMALYDQAGQEQSFDEALKELANDDIGRMIAEPELLQSFIEANKTNRTLLQRLADAFHALWQKLTGKDRQQVKTAEEALLAALKASEAQAAKLERAGQVTDFAQEQGEGGEYSIKRTRTMDWTTQVNGWFDHDGTIKSSDSLYLGESETWLENVTSAPLYIPGSVMTKATRVPKGSKSGHAMTQAELLQLSERIKSAPAVIVNPSRNALIYVTDMEDSHGWPVIAAFDMNNDLHGEVAHKATSIYGRESGLGGLFGNLGADATIFVQSKSKFDALLSGTGKLYPQLLAKIKLADGSVAQPDGKVNGNLSLKGATVLSEEAARLEEQGRREGWSRERMQGEIRAAVQRVYEGRSLTKDGELYSYDFLTKLPDMAVTALPEVDAVRTTDGKVDSRLAVDLGMENARAVGTEREGKVFVRNRYTGKQLLITSDSIRHGLNGSLNRLLTNARLGTVIGDVVQNAVPINALTNQAEGITGTYAMAGYATDSKGREFVAIVTVEQYDGNVAGLEVYDVTHAVSGRQKKGSQASTKLQGFYPIKATNISIADLLRVVNSTHQSILSEDVLARLEETRDPEGQYTGKAKYSLKGGAVLSQEAARLEEQGRREGWSQERLQGEIRAAVSQVLEDLAKEYGTIKPGENPVREVAVPRKTAKNEKVSQTVRTILEAGATPEAAIPSIEELTAKGEFSYQALSDKTAIERAEASIERMGWGSSLGEWFKTVDGGGVSKDNTAMGWALYNHAVNAGDTRTAMDVLQRMVRHQRNAAQAVQATRILKQLAPETQLYGVQRSVESLQEELNKRFGDEKAPKLVIDQELAERLMQAADQEERDGVMKDIYRDIGRQMPSTFLDKWNAWRYLSMLGNPRTHVRNIAGNAGFAPVVLAKDMTATAIERAVYAVSGGRLERSKGLVGLGKQGRGLLAAAWGDYAHVKDAALGGGKYSEFQNANRYIEEGRTVFTSKPGKALEAARRANSTALDAEDAWFSQPHYAYAMAQYCAAHGITEDMIRAGGAEIGKAREYAIREAQKATYRDTNTLSQLLGGLGGDLRRSSNAALRGAGMAVEGILPFRKTPANILARGLEYSPLGLVKGLSYDLAQVRRGNMTGAEAIDNISAGLTGTGLLALGVYLAAQGLLRGKGSGDDKEKELEKLQGHQDYALELGDVSVTLDWLAPEALPLFIGANLWETAQRDGDVTMAEMLGALKNVSDPLLEMSCLQSLNDVFDSVGYASENEINPLMAALVSAATSYLTQGLPTVFGQAERVTETQRETTYTSKDAFLTGDMQYFLGKVMNKLPGEFQQISYIDAWGRTEDTGDLGQRAFGNFLNPAYVSEIEVSPMEEELVRLYEATGDGGVFPSRARKYVQVNGKRKDLTAEEYVDYATRKGTAARKLVTALTRAKGYAGLEQGEQAAAVKDAYQYAEQTARRAVARDYTPDSWVTKAQTAEREYGISTETYILLRNRTAGLESIKNADGEAIANSKGLQIMETVYDNTPGMGDRERGYLFEALGAGKSIRHYNKAKVKEELGRMRKK